MAKLTKNQEFVIDSVQAQIGVWKYVGTEKALESNKGVASIAASEAFPHSSQFEERENFKSQIEDLLNKFHNLVELVK